MGTAAPSCQRVPAPGPLGFCSLGHVPGCERGPFAQRACGGFDLMGDDPFFPVRKRSGLRGGLGAEQAESGGTVAVGDPAAAGSCRGAERGRIMWMNRGGGGKITPAPGERLEPGLGLRGLRPSALNCSRKQGCRAVRGPGVGRRLGWSGRRWRGQGAAQKMLPIRQLLCCNQEKQPPYRRKALNPKPCGRAR